MFGEPRRPRVAEELAAEPCFSSELSLVECDRAVITAEVLGRIGAREAADLRGSLAEVASGWTIVRLSEPVLDRAREPFPAEPVRTLDALHLASALHVRSLTEDLDFLSLDDRLRSSATFVGFRVVPD